MKQKSITTGRINQKLKTRNNILGAAKMLIKSKKKINLEMVADKADISRATIYRYFPNIDILVSEAALDNSMIAPEVLAEQLEGLTLKERLLFIQNYYNSSFISQEIAFRRYLSIVISQSIMAKGKLRGARRVDAFQLALKPFKEFLPNQIFKNLVNISAVLSGSEPLIVTKDVCSLSNSESEKLLNWGIEMIIKNVEINYLKD